MKFWLSCFFLLFVAAELFEWVARLGSMQLHGAWLILGGMGLAAASNASHLPKLSGSRNMGAIAENSALENSLTADQKVSQPESTPQPVKAPSITEQSQEESISFKVRSPWR